MTRKTISYSEVELAWIKSNCREPRAAMHAEFCAKFDRADVSLVNLSSLCKRNSWLTGRNGRFEKGGMAHNKGKKLPFNEKNARTRFKKGHRPHSTKFAGYERITKDGYVMISIRNQNPHTGYERRFVLKHRWLWEQIHGPVPDGMCLKCLGDRLETAPSNWELVPRELLPRLNGKSGRGYDAAPDVLKPTIMAVVKLEHRARNIREQQA